MAIYGQESRCRQLGIAVSAAVAVRISFAGTFCAAAGLIEASLNRTREEAAVTIPPDAEAQILRYYHVEKWRTGTIARQLHLHYDTVARVLAQAGLPRHGQPPRPSKADPLFRHRRIRADVMPTWPWALGAHLTAWRPGPTAKWAKRQADAWRHAKKH